MRFTATASIQLGGHLSDGDKLVDAITRKEYAVSRIGPQALRSYGTRNLLTWSREISLGLQGDCRHLEKRLLVDANSPNAKGMRLYGRFVSHPAGFPIDVPIVGVLRSGKHSLESLCIFSLDGGIDVVVADEIAESAHLGDYIFGCLSPQGNSMSVRVKIERSHELAAAGPVLEWHETEHELRLLT